MTLDAPPTPHVMSEGAVIEPGSDNIRIVVVGNGRPGWYDDLAYASETQRFVNREEVEEEFYVSDSVIPIGPWSRCSRSWFKQTESLSDNVREGETVAIFGLPRHLLLKAQSALQAHAISPPDTFIGSREAQALQYETAEWLKLELAAESVDTLAMGVNNPGLRTVTIDRAQGALIGMHIDSLDGADLDSRRTARVRAAVNFGPGTRWFLLLPTPLECLARSLKVGDRPADAFCLTGASVYAAGLLTPVIALRINPGEGYIAPTDALFHDASSMWAQDRSFNSQMLVRLTSHQASTRNRDNFPARHPPS